MAGLLEELLESGAVVDGVGLGLPIGSSLFVELFVEEVFPEEPHDESGWGGDGEIEEGQEIAYFEANKASADLLSPLSGTVSKILIEEETTVKVDGFFRILIFRTAQ